GENDAREVQPGQDPWPGKTGAVRVATSLVAAWGVPVRYGFPPANVKDVRVLLHQAGDGARKGLLDSLDATGEVLRAEGGAESLVTICSYLNTKGGPKRYQASRTDETLPDDVQTKRYQTPSEPFGPSASRVLAEGISPVRCQRGYAPVILKR